MAHRVNERRAIDLTTQATDEHLHQFHVVFVLPLPDPFAQFGSSKDTARFPHQHTQQRELSRGKLDPPIAASQFIINQVKREIGHLKFGPCFFRITTTKRGHTRDQLLHGKWLCEIIICSERQTVHAVAQLAARSQNQDATIHMCLAQAAQDFKTVDAWQHYVEYDEIEARFAGKLARFLTVMQYNRLMSRGSECARDVASETYFIFNNKNMH